jgi:hypothetical protein
MRSNGDIAIQPEALPSTTQAGAYEEERRFSLIATGSVASRNSFSTRRLWG